MFGIECHIVQSNDFFIFVFIFYINLSIDIMVGKNGFLCTYMLCFDINQRKFTSLSVTLFS